MVNAILFSKVALYISVPIVAFFIGISFMGLKRKLIARVQRRYGPPIWQPLIDIGKLLAKERNINHGIMYDLGPIMLVAASIMVVYFIPMANLKLFTSSADVIALMYIMVVGTLGMALGAGESANPNASIGIARGLMLMFGYDLPYVIVIIAAALKYHTTNLYQMVILQHNTGHWGIYLMPIAAFVAFLVLLAEKGEHPFDVVVAPAEVATGPMAEYGGRHLGYMMIAHAFQVYAELSLFVIIFLGGASNLLEFYIKLFVVFFLVAIVSVITPRYRIDDAIRFFWKWPTVLAVISLILVLNGF